MPRTRRIPTGFLIALTSCALAPAATLPAWTDVKGNTFHGEPSEVLGPLAVFRTAPDRGSKVAWRLLTPEDCVRFYETVKNKPARAEDWAQAQGIISRELIGNIKRLQGDKVVDASLGGRPEPEVFMLFFVDNSEGKSWEMVGHSLDPFKKLQAAFPGQVEGLFFGAQHSATDHYAMAASSKVPWLIADYDEQTRHLSDIMDLAPKTPGDFRLTVVNRDGVPLFSARMPSATDVDKVFSELTAMLDLMRPENSHSWPDRLYYQRAVQLAIYVHGHGDPVLVGQPLVSIGLRQRNIFQVDAQIAVAADGHVTDVKVKPDGEVPPAMIGPLGDALKKAAVFVPAIDNGNFVDGTYAYHLQIPH